MITASRRIAVSRLSLFKVVVVVAKQIKRAFASHTSIRLSLFCGSLHPRQLCQRGVQFST